MKMVEPITIIAPITPHKAGQFTVFDIFSSFNNAGCASSTVNVPLIPLISTEYSPDEFFTVLKVTS